MKKIFHKLLYGYLFLIIVLLFFLSILSYNIMKSFYIDSLIVDLNKIANSIKPEVMIFLNKKDYNALDKYIKETGKRIDTRITVILKNGKVVADSKKPPETMENHITRPEIIFALKKGKIGHSIRFSTTVKAHMLYVAIPLENNGGKVFAILRVSLFIKNIDKFLTILGKNIYFMSFILFILSIGIAIVFSKNISKPIDKIIDASEKIAKGSFKIRVNIKRDDEIGELIDNFNFMAEKLDSFFSELISQKEKLKNIIDSINEGVIVIDKQGKIETTNHKFKNIFNISDLKNRYYWEILNNVEFEELIKSTAEKKQRQTREYKRGDKIFLCETAIMQNNKIIIVFHDITERKKMEIYKRELIDNVSHELKTPLTLIQGFVETLEEEEQDETKRKYLEIIKKNSERLINIVNDLAVLSKTESKFSDKSDFKKISLNPIINNTAMLFKERMEKKGIKFKIKIPKSDIFIIGDSFLMEEVLTNLLDNAYKYTEKGKIVVSLRKEKNNAILTVSDTGIGIPSNSIERIFERFYVVDKSRSRQTGGTGLGLSIVKHIILLHSGNIKVESEEGKGSEFIITLPAV